jgi:hypothetical protein
MDIRKTRASRHGVLTAIRRLTVRMAEENPRLIGTVRRECLDRTLFWTAADLEMKLLEFQHFYNGHRTHAGLNGRTPEPSHTAARACASVHSYRWQPHCRGMYHTPMAA